MRWLCGAQDTGGLRGDKSELQRERESKTASEWRRGGIGDTDGSPFPLHAKFTLRRTFTAGEAAPVTM